VKGEGGEGESKQKSFSIRGRIKKFFFSFVKRMKASKQGSKQATIIINE